MKKHLTPDGPKDCDANIRNCKYGEHFDNEDDANVAYNNKMKSEHGSTKTLQKNNVKEFSGNPMKELLNRFYTTKQELLKNKDYIAASELDDAEILVNNCHGMDSEEIIQYMNNTLTFEGSGYDMARSIVNEYNKN